MMDDDLNTKIDNILTPKEKEDLEKIQNKLIEAFSNTEKKDYDDALNFRSREELVTPAKITDAPKEIIFMLKVIVTETNAEGEPVRTLDVLEQNYHIPVMPGKEHNIYVEKFLEKFRSKLQEACGEANNE